jgi:predicted nucleic acid-binding Zn ribbon protein
MEAQKKCLECERPVFGRADKKFCSDGCHNAYNNKNKAAATNYIRNVNNLLAKNRRILLAFSPSDKAKKHRDQLLNKDIGNDFYLIVTRDAS